MYQKTKQNPSTLSSLHIKRLTDYWLECNNWNLNFWEENIGENLNELGLYKTSLNLKNKLQKKLVNWTLLISKTFIFQKTLLRKWKGRPQTGRKCLQNISDKYVYLKYIKKSYNPIIRKQPSKKNKQKIILENFQFLKELTMHLSFDPAKWNESICLHKDLCMSIHCGFTCSSQKLDTTIRR